MAQAQGAATTLMQGETPAEPGAALHVADLYKSFGDLEVLRGVSLAAHEHDVIASWARAAPARARCSAASTC